MLLSTVVCLSIMYFKWEICRSFDDLIRNYDTNSRTWKIENWKRLNVIRNSILHDFRLRFSSSSSSSSKTVNVIVIMVIFISRFVLSLFCRIQIAELFNYFRAACECFFCVRKMNGWKMQRSWAIARKSAMKSFDHYECFRRNRSNWNIIAEILLKAFRVTSCLMQTDDKSFR